MIEKGGTKKMEDTRITKAVAKASEILARLDSMDNFMQQETPEELRKSLRATRTLRRAGFSVLNASSIVKKTKGAKR